MGQDFHVVRCYSCQSFQVQQVKKANRWSCKLCGHKQSLLKEFGRGSGADCRRHVQKLNAMRGAMMDEQDQNAWLLWKQVEADGEDEPEEHDQVNQTQVNQTQVSRWSKYVDTAKEAEPEREEENVLMDRQQHHGNNVSDRKRKRREGWTDREPEQSDLSSPVMKPLGASAKTRTTCLNSNSPPGLNSTRPPGLNSTSPPGLKSTRPPGLNSTRPPGLNSNSPPGLTRTSPPRTRTGPLSRWACFLSSDCPVEEEPSVSGWSQSVGRADCHSGNVICQTPPPNRPRPLLPVSSMFDSGAEFNYDDEFIFC